MKKSLKDQLIVARAFARNIGHLAGAWTNSSVTHVPSDEFDVPGDFFGICAAGAPDRACDDYVAKRLRELGIQSVRVDMTPNAPDFQERFLLRMIDDGFKVCLHLVQPAKDASDMNNPEARGRWHDFVIAMLDRHGKGVELVEIGSTCNRRKWSGYTIPSYLECWRIAWTAAKERAIPVAGPNVTDFEPIYNIALLGEMKRAGMLPDAHTDNLFVERATEPEAFDHKIMGRRFAGMLRFNLIKKARLLNNISSRFGVSATICSQVSWSMRRIARLHEEIEEKQADYAARYCCLAAASGALQRVYWGPLIGQREGLIDDGTDEFPETPHVTLYGRVNGKASDFRVRPAFFAFQTVNRLIAGTVFKRKHRTEPGLEILEFEARDKLIHAVWTRDGRRAPVSSCYEPETMRRAVIQSRDGAPLDAIPAFFSESPLYLSWPAGSPPDMKSNPAPIPSVRFANTPGVSFIALDIPSWTGFALASDEGAPVDAAALIESATGASERRNTDGHSAGDNQQSPILREGRNRVWKEHAPWDKSRMLIFKTFKRRGRIRKILDARKPDKAQRSWNGAQELIRRGIQTPMPIAFFRKTADASDSVCCFVCRGFENSHSARDIFTAFATGANEFRNIKDSDFYKALAAFLRKMHQRGIFFRDLSAGNVLWRSMASGGIEFALIDTARARFYPQKLGIWRSLLDLMRICHPLHWKGRDAFIREYMAAGERRFKPWMKAPFIYYDLKHRIKNAIKPLRKKLKRTSPATQKSEDRCQKPDNPKPTSDL